MTAPTEQLGPAGKEASLLALIMVEQPIIQAEISSVENFDGTKNKFKLWTAPVENAAQISD